MLKRFHFVCLSLLVCFNMAWAEDITPLQAEVIAKDFFVQHGVMTSNKKDLLRVNVNDVGNCCQAAPFYVFNSEDRTAFVVVSGDDRTRQVLAYGLDGAFEQDNVAPGAKYFLDWYASQIEELRNGAEPANIARNVGVANEVLLETAKWNQTGDFWNKYCPNIEGPAPAGCTCVAMAIYMRYYKWPIHHGWGSHSYTTNVYGINLSADFEHTDYNLASLPLDNAQGADWTQEQQDAVATLLLHCGIASNADYKPTGSSAGSPDCALFNYFGYTKGAGVCRNSMSDEEWKALLRKELDAGHPLLYFGGFEDKHMFHSFICDGYDANGFFHFNLGWGGYASSYYSIDEIVSGSQNYSYWQSAILNAFPDYERNGVPDTELSLEYDENGNCGLEVDEILHPNLCFRLRLLALKSIKPYNFCGEVAVFLCDKDGNKKIKLGSSMFEKPFNYGSSYNTYSINCTMPSQTEVNETDRLCVFSSSDNGNTWIEIPCSEPEHGCLYLKDCYDPSPYMEQLYMDYKENAVLGLELDETIHPDKKFNIIVHELRNRKLSVFSGKVGLFLCDKDGNRKELLGEKYIEELKNRYGWASFTISNCALPSGTRLNDTDRLYVFSSMDDGVTWYRVNCVDEDKGYVVLSEHFDDIPVHFQMCSFYFNEITPGLFMDDINNIKVGERFVVNTHNLQNVSYCPYSGELALFICDSNGNLKVNVGGFTVNEMKSGSYYGEKHINCLIPSGMEIVASDYIGLFSRKEGSDEWLKVPCDIVQNERIVLDGIVENSIINVLLPNDVQEYYNLSGNRVKDVDAKGIYIIRSGKSFKKVLVND